MLILYSVEEQGQSIQKNYAQGIIHRDVKPSNISLSIDFLFANCTASLKLVDSIA